MDLIKLNNILKKEKLEETNTNQYLFLMFFLERCQFISNLIKLIDPTITDTLVLGIKYNILYLKDFDKISKKIKDFKKEFDKNDLINEILSFIKSSIGVKNIDDEFTNKKKENIEKPLVSRNKIKSLINSFDNLNDLIKEIDKSLIIKDNDIHFFFIENDYIVINKKNSIKLERDINKIELDWINLKKNKKHSNKAIYDVLKPWYKF